VICPWEVSTASAGALKKRFPLYDDDFLTACHVLEDGFSIRGTEIGITKDCER
jgi:hypothetical protein